MQRPDFILAGRYVSGLPGMPRAEPDTLIAFLAGEARLHTVGMFKLYPMRGAIPLRQLRDVAARSRTVTEELYRGRYGREWRETGSDRSLLMDILFDILFLQFPWGRRKTRSYKRPQIAISWEDNSAHHTAVFEFDGMTADDDAATFAAEFMKRADEARAAQ